MDNRLARCARRRWREPRSRVSRTEMVLLAVALLVLAGGGLLATSAGGAAGDEPPVSHTPDAPAVIIAKVRGTDLSGASLEVENGDYLLFTSTAFGNKRDNVPVFVGRPGDWSAPVDALPVLPPWALPVAQGGTTWQPEIERFGSHYVLYYSATVRGSRPVIHCLGTATSMRMIGPYQSSAQPIVCQTNEGGDIDAQVVMDNTSSVAQPYLIWKSDNNSGPGHGTDRIWSQPLAADGLRVVGSPTVIYGTDVGARVGSAHCRSAATGHVAVRRLVAVLFRWRRLWRAGLRHRCSQVPVDHRAVHVGRRAALDHEQSARSGRRRGGPLPDGWLRLAALRPLARRYPLQMVPTVGCGTDRLDAGRAVCGGGGVVPLAIKGCASDSDQATYNWGGSQLGHDGLLRST